MAVTQQQTVFSSVASGGTVFPFGCRVLAQGDLVVQIDGVEQPTSAFTVTGLGNNSGGTVTFNSAPTVGSLVRILRATQIERTTDYQIGGDFEAPTVNLDFDRVYMLCQDVLGGSVEIANVLRVPAGETIAGLPKLADRTGKLLTFDAQGNPQVVAAASQDATSVSIALGDFITSITGVVGGIASTVASHSTSILALQAIDNDALQEFTTSLAAGTAARAEAFGDSTFAGADPANLANNVAIPPPLQCQNFVNTFFGNVALTLANFAISGTTATQMIAGTDGSGSTFAAKMATSSARIVLCNHGVNDAFGANATTPAAYRTALLAFVKTVRGVSKTPILVTPHPCLTIGGFGSQARAEATARFAQIMREVAANHGVRLVDNNLLLSRLLNIDGQLPLSVLPDGVHGPQATYVMTGNNLASTFLRAQCESLTHLGQRIPVSSASFRATGQANSVSTSSRVGSVMTSGTGGAQSLRVAFEVGETGLDLVLGHPIYNQLSNAIGVNLDGTNIATMSQYSANFGASFWQDFETMLARNIPFGFHLLTLTSASSAIGAHYLRGRATDRPLMLPTANATPSQRVLLAKKLVLESGAGTFFVGDTLPSSHQIETAEFEFTAQLLVSSGVCIGSNIGGNASAPVAERAVSIGLNASGFLSVDECTAPGTYTTTVIGATNLSSASHLYRFTLSPTNVLTCWVDDTQVGTTTTLTGPYFGGLIGAYKAGGGSTLTITDLCRVWRL